jgi:hypothetical protein
MVHAEGIAIMDADYPTGQWFGLGCGSEDGKQGSREKTAPYRGVVSHVRRAEDFTEHAGQGLL